MVEVALYLAVFLIVLVAAVLAVQVWRDMAAARDRLARLKPVSTETACGPTEYAQTGNGPPVLIVHGIFGGFDQGLVIAKGNLGPDFTAIAASRFGYLGTPMPKAATPAAQADAFACLLDRLGIARAAVFGTSAGATAALQFALRHPERTAGLVLMSANAPGPVEVGTLPRPVANVLFRSNVAFWLLTRYFPANLRSIMGVPEGFALTREQEAEIASVMKTILPVRPRAEGALFDMYVSNPAINSGYPLEQIAVPVLILNARDDPLTLHANAKAMAARIPGARMVSIGDGGHMLLGHKKEVRAAITEFLGTLSYR